MKKLILICAALLVLSGCGSTGEKGSAVVEPAPADTVTVPPLATPTAEPEKEIGSGSSAPEASTPPEATDSPLVGSGPWNGDLDALSLDDFPTQLATGDMVLNGGKEDYLYLVSQFPEQNIWLYGLAGGRGVILRCGTKWEYFDLTYVSSHCALPSMAYGDYDGDGQGEVAVDLTVDMGSVGDIQELHIFEVSGDIWTDRWLSDEDYQAILEQSVYFSLDSSAHTVTGQVGFTSVTCTLEADQEELASLEGYSGSFRDGVSFDVTQNPISAVFRATLRREHTQPVLVGMVHADVVYTGSAFGLANLSIAVN